MTKRTTACLRLGSKRVGCSTAAASSVDGAHGWLRSYAKTVRIATRYSSRITGVSSPTLRCEAGPGLVLAAALSCPISSPSSKKPSSTTPNAPASTWPWAARVHTGAGRCSRSIITRNTRLSTQLPSALPTAKLGVFAMLTLVMPVASSGSEVTLATSVRPIQLPDRPVRCAMASP